MIVRAKAPLRISFGGGGTDVEPYPSEHGGAVLSATIDLYAFASLEHRPDGEVKVFTDDGDSAHYPSPEDMVFDGHLDLVKASLRHMAPGAGLELHLSGDAPPGSGLGTSSALVVAMLSAVAEHTHVPLTPYELARRAYQVERVDLRQAGGMQDQYAAAFGGFNFIEFSGPDRVVVNPLRIRSGVLNELHGSLLLCHTGITRKSGGILRRQVEGYRTGKTLRTLSRIKELAVGMKEALLTGDLDRFAQGLNEGWEQKRDLAEGITNERVDELYERALKAGATAGKLLGAGGGGYVLLFCPFTERTRVAETMEEAGARVVRFHFEERGAETWRVR
ncbi:MAG TPA: GHMP kinase [Actinomycetota bacterium]|jgi:D-glycero-alpha-D-manno-heptose-7-phosphate kinase